jgi:hypothetical protein
MSTLDIQDQVSCTLTIFFFLAESFGAVVSQSPHLLTNGAVDTILTDDNVSREIRAIFAKHCHTVLGVLYSLNSLAKMYSFLVPKVIVQFLNNVAAFINPVGISGPTGTSSEMCI